ncbi:hypothetical protein [Myxococcus stipitatus]|uniref:hypothetical protein n=1 Tax=Myxococcus stipitatus TaxID=83455 RepID=UPI0030D0367E
MMRSSRANVSRSSRAVFESTELNSAAAASGGTDSEAPGRSIQVRPHRAKSVSGLDRTTCESSSSPARVFAPRASSHAWTAAVAKDTRPSRET